MSPAVEIFDNLYLSGNSIYENDVASAISHCEELGYSEHDIIIDSLLSGSIYMEYFDTAKANTWSVMVHSSKMWKYYDKVHGILRAKITHQDVMFRYLIGPDFTMPNKITPMEFTVEKTLKLLYEGEQQTRSTINKLVQNPAAEVERQLYSSRSIYYYNKDRQKMNEKKIRM